MKPGKNGELTFESLGEIDVLNAGLDTLAEFAGDGPVGRHVKVMRGFAGDVMHVVEGAMAGMANDPVTGDLLADAAPTGAALTFEDPEHVTVARFAVSIVALNAPGDSEIPHLQDPMRYDAALGMAEEYHRATGTDIYPQ